jgi:hypothetical protein
MQAKGNGQTPGIFLEESLSLTCLYNMNDPRYKVVKNKPGGRINKLCGVLPI